MADEFHVASLLVFVRADHKERIELAVRQLSGCELHASTPEGKMIVTVESSDEQDINDRLNAIQTIPGVVSAALIYHEVDSSPAEDSPSGAIATQGPESLEDAAP